MMLPIGILTGMESATRLGPSIQVYLWSAVLLLSSLWVCRRVNSVKWGTIAGIPLSNIYILSYEIAQIFFRESSVTWTGWLVVLLLYNLCGGFAAWLCCRTFRRSL